MKSKLLGRSSTYLFVMSAVLLVLLAPAYLGEMLGMAHLVPTRTGVVTETYTSDPVYSAQDGTYSSYTIYTFTDSQHNTFSSSLPIGGSDPLNQGDPVTLGMFGGDLVSINGHVVDQLDFWQRAGLGVMLGLFGIGLVSLAQERRDGQSKEESAGMALFLALIFVMPAIIPAGVVMGLGYVFEIVGVPFWPLILMALAIFISWRFYERTRNKPPLVAAKPQEA